LPAGLVKAIVVEMLNKQRGWRPMATVNFSVPDDVKRAFNEVFAGENKSAVLTRLMRQAVEERRRLQRRVAAVDALLDLRGRQAPVSDEVLQHAREDGRP
jgi:hypothetical protein